MKAIEMVRLASKYYPDNYVEDSAWDPDRECVVPDCGDSLAVFIAAEAANAVDYDGDDDYQRQMLVESLELAIEQLRAVRDGVMLEDGVCGPDENGEYYKN